MEALLVLVARPWLSMRKYYQRGYAYCQLDVGHLAANLAIYTAAPGHGSTLHLRFSHTAFAEYLNLGGLCREPLAVLSFAAARPTACPEPASWPPAGLEPAALELPGEGEIRCWESLRGIRSLDCPFAPPCPSASAPLLVEPAAAPEEAVLPLPIGRAQPSAAREWRAAILGRRSAKGFRDEPLSAAHIGELLGALRDEGFPSDFARDSSARLGVRLVARNVEGLEGVFAYAPRSHSLHRLDPRTGDPRPACMHQEIARGAAALILLHAPIGDLMASQGYSAFSELHIQAGELAQRIYLAAARIGAVGMTCIGGFDDHECSALARLEDADETLYVILLGLPDEAAVKQDRLAVAFSHGHTTREDA
jgi:nitroreductase